MNRAQLLQHFDTLAETPDAVAKLRNFVLSLAVRGLLLQQNADDEKPVQWREFVAKVAQTKTQDEEAPFDLPKSWRWVPLNDVADYAAADKVNPSEIKDDDWVLDLEEIEKDTSRIVRMASFAEKQSSSTKAKFLPGDVLYGKLRPYLNKVVVAPQAGFCTTEIVPIRSRGLIEPTYLCIFLRSPDFVSYANFKSYGMKMPRLGTDDAVSAWVAVPPPAEQRRIVAKVEELLALCDELEAAQIAAREHRTRLVRSALDHLTTGVRPSPGAATSARTTVLENSNARRPHHAAAPEDGRAPDDFQQHAAFVLQHSDLVLDSVSQLRQCIRALAVQGRLVKQVPKDGNGADVVSKFSLREQPDADHILDLELPAHWAITAFSNIARIRSGVTKGRNLAGRETKSFPYLRVANVQRGYLELDVMKDIEIPVEELEKFRLELNDLLITEGGDWDKVGRTAIWQEEIADCIHQNHIFRARLVSEELKPEWFMLYLNSPVGRRYFESASKQTTNLASINATELRGCPVPVPPLAEQQRIVAKVDELMRWCDALETRLTAAQTTAATLLDATLHQILAAPSN